MIDVQFTNIFNAVKKSYYWLDPKTLPRSRDRKNYTFLQDWARNWIAARRRSLGTLSTMPEVYFGFVREPELNAIAGLSDTGEVIAIFEGAVPALWGLFARMLSHPHVFPDVGNAALEKAPAPILLRPDARAFPADNPNPRDPVRQEYASRLAFYAYRFLVAHELCHIRHGHVHYNKQKTGQGFIAELHSVDTAEEALTSHALEMDADCYALSTIIGEVLTELRPEGTTREDAPAATLGRELPAAVWLALRDLALAVYTMFRLCATVDNSAPETWLLQNHPSPRIRQGMMFAQVHRVLGEWVSDEAAAQCMERIAGETILTVESAWRLLEGHSSDKTPILAAIGPDGQAHVAAINKRWSDIAVDLSPLAHCEELAP